MSVDLSGMAVTVSRRIGAPRQAVWDLLSDLPAMAELSDEVVTLDWTGPRTFRATNRSGAYEWTVDGHVVDLDPPQLLRWTVLDPARPSSTWEQALVPDGEHATVVTSRFVHGPGPSGVRAAVERDPAAAKDVVAARSSVLELAMARSLERAARRLEQ